MTAHLVALVAAWAAIGLALVVVVQPAGAWEAAAEHSKQLWCSWVAVLVGVSIAGPLLVGSGWSATAWALACCLLAVLQPSLLGDLREVRVHTRRVTASAVDLPVHLPADLAPISWRAPDA
jgi:hypothetical protein